MIRWHMKWFRYPRAASRPSGSRRVASRVVFPSPAAPPGRMSSSVVLVQNFGGERLLAACICIRYTAVQKEAALAARRATSTVLAHGSVIGLRGWRCRPQGYTLWAGRGTSDSASGRRRERCARRGW